MGKGDAGQEAQLALWDVSALLGGQDFFFFLGPHLLPKEVPRLGVKSELQLPAHATATDPS